MDVHLVETLTINAQDQLQEAARKLCYFAAEGAQTYVNDLIEHLVKHSLADLPPGAHSTRVIYDQLNTNIRLHLEFEQVLAALDRLVAKRIVSVIDKDNERTARYRLPVEQISGLKQDQRRLCEFEARVLHDWIADVRTRQPELTDTDAALLLEDLNRFAMRLYSLHSIESVSLYFGDDANIAALVEKLDGEGLRSILPERSPQLHDIRMYELPRFFRDAPLDRKRYIAQQMNPIFLLHMLQLDPSCARLMSQHIQGGTLFLDTNFIYRLLGFHGPDLKEASHRLLELSRGLGYTSVVSPRTVEEYRRSLEQFKGRTHAMPHIEPVVAEAALQAALEEDTNTQYWRLLRDHNGNFSTDTFYGLYRQIEAILEPYNIAIDTRYDEYLRANDTLLAQEESLLRSTLPDWDPRHDSIVSHDAYHRLLILALRQGQETESPLEMPFWFLTCDTKLVVYDRRARMRQKLTIPYCVLSSHWMQLLSPFCTAVEGFEVMQAETLDSPLFRLFPSPDPEILQDIITRMAVSEKIPPTAIAKMITNQAFIRAFADEKDESKRVELLEGFYGKYIDELEGEHKRLAAMQTQTTAQVAYLQTMVHEKDSLIQDALVAKQQLEERIEHLSSEHEALIHRTQHSEQQSVADRAAKEVMGQQLENLQGELQAMNERAQRTHTQYQEELQNLRGVAHDDKAHYSGLVASLQTNQQRQQAQIARQRKITFIGLTWFGCMLALMTLKPWEWEGDYQWATLTIVVVASSLTQVFVVHWQTTPRLKRILLIVINLIVLPIVALLPFGVSVSTSWGVILGIVSIIAMIYAIVAVPASGSIGNGPS